tara:strand:- start:7 stop:795 length:789 start_codon:yes stop_codon:yes gene_type:complete
MGKPKLGQVFLIDRNIIRKIIDSLSILPGDHLLEIGCGDGILTEALVNLGVPLTVVEIDQACLDKTKQRLGNDYNINWLCRDVLTFDFSLLSAPIKLVANIPYYISAKLIQKLVRQNVLFSDITIMIQKEFAQKCVAKPYQKVYTALSVFTQYHFDIEYLFDVSRHCFSPVPNIDSAVIKLTPNRRLYDEHALLLERIVAACFWGKRKKLSTSLRHSPYCLFKEDVRDITAIQGLLSKRADQLTIEEYSYLTTILKPYILLE